MSEPIFRAFCNDSKEFLYEGEFNIRPDGSIWTHGSHWTEEREYNAVLCRSTGLKDRNGKMIFEFDIIQSGIYRLIVQFRDGSFVVKIYNSLETYVSLSKYYLNLNQFEKIGSSLANPELLEQKQNG